MLKLLGSLCVASGGALAWYVQQAERRRERDTLSDLQRAFRRMGEEVRMARTPLPVLLSTLAEDCEEPAAAFFRAASRAAAVGENLPESWREHVEALPLSERDKSAVCPWPRTCKATKRKSVKQYPMSSIRWRTAPGRRSESGPRRRNGPPRCGFPPRRCW